MTGNYGYYTWRGFTVKRRCADGCTGNRELIIRRPVGVRDDADYRVK